MNNWSNHLIEILLLEPPKTQPREDGFMDIVDIQYHENTISRIYAYFLNADKNKDVANLFLETLLEIIKFKTTNKILEFDNYRCYREFTTEKGNRIDLLIKSGDENFKPGDSAIIIENKIFSAIHNDLEDYWNTTKLEPDSKVGVMLTLSPIKIPEKVNSYYINITHTDWMNAIKAKGLPYNLKPKEYVYLNDFIKNMDGIIVTNNKLSEDARFFFEHPSKVLRAKETYDAARTHILTQLQILSEKVGMHIYGSSASWRHIWDYKSHVYYVFGFENLLTPEPSIKVILEVYKDGLAKKEELKELLKDNGTYLKLDDDGQSSNSWAHLAYKNYPLSVKELENLGETLYKKLEDDFFDAYNLVFESLKVS